VTSFDRDDDAVRAAMRELRAADELETPAFDAVLSRRKGAGSRERVLVVRRLAIAAGLVLAAIGVYGVKSSRRARLTVPEEVIALSTWRPATDALLEIPGRSLLRQTPQLHKSVLDIKGDFR